MQNEKFMEMVRQRASEQQEQTIDWTDRRDWWIEQVKSLLACVKAWLKPLTDEGTVRVTCSNITLNEEKTLGEYEVPQASVRLGSEELKLKPVGSVIVGGFGRIDVIGPMGRAMLVLAPLDDNLPPEQRRDRSEWLLTHPERRHALRKLTQETFQEIFADLFGMQG